MRMLRAILNKFNDINFVMSVEEIGLSYTLVLDLKI
jgi:hypothetical protein